MTKNNPSNPKEQYDAILSKIDQTQLKTKTKSVNPAKDLEDKPSEFTSNMGFNKDQRDGEVIRSDPELDQLFDARYSKKLSIDSQNIREE